MAFTATVESINFQNDTFNVCVQFNDSSTSWTSTKTYNFDPTETQAQMVASITADGTAYKANLTKNAALQARVGFVITI